MASRAVCRQFDALRYYQCLCSCPCVCQGMYLLIPVIKAECSASFTRFGFRPKGNFRLSPYKIVKLITSVRLFTQPGLETGREFTGRLPGKSRSSPLLCPAAESHWCQCHVHTLRFLAGCSRAITFHCRFSRVLEL